MSPHNPDVGTSVTGEHLGAVRAFQQDHKEVHFDWFDFGCLPQKLKATDGKVLKELNPAEKMYFKKALSLVNFLYLHGKVLVLLDAEHSTRFWCLYEAFLASHKFDGTSLVPEQSIEGTRTPCDHITLTTARPSCHLYLEEYEDGFSSRMRHTHGSVEDFSGKLHLSCSFEASGSRRPHQTGPPGLAHDSPRTPNVHI